MNDADRSRLQRILASFDEPGLVALANVGLLRRARKDLEAGGLTHEESDTAVVVRGPGWAVTMPPDGPAHARDDTRASGVTRQILAATIYLRDQWATPPAPVAASGPREGEAPAEPVSLARRASEGSELARRASEGSELARRASEETAPSLARRANDTGSAGASPSPDEAAALEEALLGVTLADLEKWAGKTMLREVLPLVRAGLDVEIEAHAGLTIRLVGHDVEARLLPGPGKKSARTLLDGILTTAPKSQHRRWALAAVLALQRSRGRFQELDEATTIRAESEGAVRSRQQVLEATRDLLESMTATGLAHPSARMRERLFTLSVSAVAVHLPRLARSLRTLSDEVEQVLSRDAAADTARLFDLVCRTHALTAALTAAGPQAPLALAGQHRTQYDPVGDLVLAGVGAYPWQTPSGYEGVTVLLWDLNARRFRSWTASRPVGAAGRFDLAQSYRAEAPWAGGGPPERFGRSLFQLRQAKANAQGRLSASQTTSAEILEPTDPAKVDLGGQSFNRWRALLEYARSLYPLGLTEKNPLDRVVVLRPAQWGERVFDELQQRFCWRLIDEAGDAVQLTLPWASVNEEAIEFLEAAQPVRDRLTAVVCRIIFARGILVEPVSLLSAGTPRGHRVLNPAFDSALIESRQSELLRRLRAKYGRDRISTTMTADDEEESGDAGSLEDAPPGLRTRLVDVERLLLQTAEAGAGRLNDLTRQRLGRLAGELDRCGLREMARGLEELGPAGSVTAVLRSGYLCRLHRQALALEASGLSG